MPRSRAAVLSAVGARTESAASVAAAVAKAPEPPPPPEVWTVRIVDDLGAPVQGVALRSVRRASVVGASTDAGGECSFVMDPGDLPVDVLFEDASGPRTERLSRPRTTIRVACPPLDVEVADGETGARCANAEVELHVGAVALEVPRGGGRVRGVPLAATGALELAASAAGGPEVGGTFPRSPWARSYRFVVPVFRWTTAELRAVDANDVELAGLDDTARAVVRAAASAEVRFPGFDVACVARGCGGVTVHLPQIAANTAAIHLWRTVSDDEHWTGSTTVSLDVRDRPVETTTVVLEPTDLGGWGGRLGGNGSGRWGSSCCGSRGPTASLVMHVRRADGTPAAGVRVVASGRRASTDAEGRATFEALALGSTTVVATRHGFLPAAVPVVVGEMAEVTVWETSPRFVVVEVVDAAGRPVPCARVLATSLEVPDGAGASAKTDCTLAWMDGDVEDLAPRADSAGRLAWRVSPGRVRYDVSLVGARTYVESDDDRVRVVLATRQ
jgi:hypothetical protein